MANVMLLVQGLLLLTALTTAYPVYGPKRLRTYRAIPLYDPPNNKLVYYDPYSQDVPMELVDMYPQDPSEILRPYYQAPYYPYYLPETMAYNYEEDLPEEKEEERAEEPYGTEWYNQDGNAKANAYFLQNLILAQMYKDADPRLGGYGYPRDDSEEFIYGEPVKEVNEDDDVSQLKSLIKDSPKRQQTKNNKPVFPDNTWTEKRSATEKGQDEVTMPRPATFHQRVHVPSSYDAIKKLLQVQKQQQKKREIGNRQPQKRSYIPNEDALVEQLDSLKKSA